MNGKHWESLFQAFSSRNRAERERGEQTRELVAWYDEHTQLVMTLLREVATERAAEFQQSSGVQIRVRWPSHPPINVGPDGPFMSFMTLSVSDREVHLYSHRVGFDAPSLHFVVTNADGFDRSRRGLLGRPGCRIERRDGGGFLLRNVVGGTGPDVLSVDDVAYRAFELLLA